MKKILSTLALSSLVLLTTGCSDFLEEENPSNVMQDFMATPSGFSMALNSVYANVRSIHGHYYANMVKQSAIRMELQFHNH